MRPILINGDIWRVVSVPAGDPSLIDRTGTARLATTDSSNFTISVSDEVKPPLLDKVVLHEVSHAITVSHGLLEPLRAVVPAYLWVEVEEWAAQLVENYALESARAASVVLGRPICIGGICFDQPRGNRPRNKGA